MLKHPGIFVILKRRYPETLSVIIMSSCLVIPNISFMLSYKLYIYLYC